MPITYEDGAVKVVTSAGSVFEFEVQDPDAGIKYLSDMNNLAAELEKHYPENAWAIERTKDTQLGDALRARAQAPREGEGASDREKRLYGTINEKAPQDTWGKGMVRSVASGATMSWADEILAPALAAYMVKTDPKAKEMGYEAVRDHILRNERDAMRRFAEEHPVSDLAGNVAGGILTAAALQPLATAIRLPRFITAPVGKGEKIAGGITVGGATGLVTGEGASESGDRGLWDRVVDAGIGSIGGLLGVVGAEGVSRLFAKFKAEGLPFLMSSNAARMGVTPEVVEFFRRVGTLTQDQFDEAVFRLRANGSESVLGETLTGGPDILDAIANSGMQAGQQARGIVEKRAKAGSQELTQAMDETLGAPQLLSQDRKIYGRANPLTDLYEEAYAVPPDWASDSGLRLEEIITKELDPSALKAAQRKERIEYGDRSQISRVAKEQEDGTFVFTELPNARQLDLIARALIDEAYESVGKGKMGGMTDTGRLLLKQGREIRTILRDQNDAYDNALKEASQAISFAQSRDAGYALLNTRITLDDAESLIGDLGKREMTQLKKGIRSFLDDQMAKVNQALTMTDTEVAEAAKGFRILSSRAARNKIKMVLGDDADQFLKKVDKAVIPLQLRALMNANSKTAIRQAINDIVDEQVSTGVMPSLQRGRILDAVGQTLTSVFSDPSAGARKKNRLAKELTSLLLTRKGADAESVLRVLRDRVNAVNVAEEVADETSSRIAPIGASAGGGSATREKKDIYRGLTDAPDEIIRALQ